LVRKVQLNSAFGALGNQYCRYYNLSMAEAITVSGQLSIRWAEDNLNRFLNKACGTEGEDYVIAVDTDSVYLRLGPLVKTAFPKKDKKKTTEMVDKFCNDVISPKINKWYEQLAQRMNAYANRMSMKREAIASKGVFVAKKRYMLAVQLGEDNVYMDDPDLKIMGIETARSSTPQIVRTRLKEAIKLILTTDEGALHSFVERFHDEFAGLPVYDIAFPRGCNGLDDYADAASIYKKGTPMHVKGSLVYNHWIKKMGLSKKYPLIRNGEKIKYVELKVPNPVREKVLSFPATFPDEFGLDAFIDKETQFEKAFIEPLSNILNCIGWKVKEEGSLEGLFA
jgi:DNA polymerase elongation subunit (family B)